MDVSEVKVLARRANGILFVMPVLIILSGFALVYSILVLQDVIEPDRDTLFVIYLFTFFDRYKISSFRYAWHDMDFERDFDVETRFDHIYDLGIGSINLFDWLLWECIISYAIYLISFLMIFIERLSIPRTIMEYDEYGLYIYRTGKPVTLLRYKELWSTYTEEDLENVELCYHRGFYSYRNTTINNPFWGVFKTGSIRIEIPDGFINLGGVYQVKEVEKEIKRMVIKQRRKYIEDMEGKIKENQRQRELEELARHNPDT